MAKLGISHAFAKYGAHLRNVQWSVSAWAPDGALVVSMWSHRYRKGPSNSAEYFDTLSRWRGAGNNELRENLADAYRNKKSIRLVLAQTNDTAYIESGRDAGKVPKDYSVRDDLIGEVVAFDGDNYVIRFQAVKGKTL